MVPIEKLQNAKTIGLLFAGGASRCVFQVGVAETLHAYGVHPSMCLGVSGGAWNAAAVAVGNGRRLRAYWRFFTRMPVLDVTNIFRDHSPFAWRKIHERAFRRYVSAGRLRAPSTLPLFVATTRLRDRKSVIVDVRTSADPLEVLLASNYLPPFYTHAPVIDGERYGDGGFSDNLPYEFLFERGCDMVVILSQKGECEGGLFRTIDDPEHEIAHEYRDRVVVIRPRHMLPLAFAERRWHRLVRVAEEGAERARSVLLGEESAMTPCRHGRRPSWYVARLKKFLRSLAPRVPLVGQRSPD